MHSTTHTQLTHNDFMQIWRLYEIIFDEQPKHRKPFYTLYSWHGEKLFATNFTIWLLIYTSLVDQKLSGKLQYKKSESMTNQEFALIDNMCRGMNKRNNTALTYRLCGNVGGRVRK